MSGNWSWEIFMDALPYVSKGLGITVGLTLSCFLFALVFGFVWLLLRNTPFRIINWFFTWVMEFIRSTPPLVQLFFIFFAWPALPVIGVSLSPFVAAILGLGVHFITYVGEVYRSGFESVDSGQWEAAKALNYSAKDKWFKIILPQAIPPTIPMLGNYFIILFNEVPLA